MKSHFICNESSILLIIINLLSSFKQKKKGNLLYLFQNLEFTLDNCLYHIGVEFLVVNLMGKKIWRKGKIEIKEIFKLF